MTHTSDITEFALDDDALHVRDELFAKPNAPTTFRDSLVAVLFTWRDAPSSAYADPSIDSFTFWSSMHRRELAGQLTAKDYAFIDAFVTAHRAIV